MSGTKQHEFWTVTETEKKKNNNKVNEGSGVRKKP